MTRVTIVVGGQYGSEGKGKVTEAIMQEQRERGAISHVVRVGGPNSGHTATMPDGSKGILRALPVCCAMPSGPTGYIAAGSVVDVEILKREIRQLGISRDRIVVDPAAALVRPWMYQAEMGIKSSIGSTGSGVGEAAITRMRRSATDSLGEPVLIGHLRDRELERLCTIKSVAPLLHGLIYDGSPPEYRSHEIIIEGSQGYGLSLYHGTQWPYMTSRDTTAAGAMSEAGIGSGVVSSVVMVLRTWPIRVGGSSGPFYEGEELTWEQVASFNVSGTPAPVEEEYTSVTKKLRRVATFSFEFARMAARANGATGLAVMGLDRLDYGDRDVREIDKIGRVSRSWLTKLEQICNVPVQWVGTGPGTIMRWDL